MKTLLLELLTEELPPKALAKLGDSFAQGIFQGLQQRGLLGANASVQGFATPRRLAVQISNVLATAPDQAIREKILPVSVALDAEGKPSAPLIKKLAALGFSDLPLSALERAQDGKAESFFYSYTAAGVTLKDGLQATLHDTVSKLPIPKVMNYQLLPGTSKVTDVAFVRPAQRLLALYGDEVVPVSVLGLQADRLTQGHRFLANAQEREAIYTVAQAQDYEKVLNQQGKVIANYTERKEKIRADLLAAAQNDQVVMPESLLDEVTSLTEWPVVYACHFEETFLAVPQECLILTMQTNQKYFALTDANGKLRNRFLIVSNLETATPNHIIQGNERVVRPRLADAKFFFEQDKKKSLAARLPQLNSVLYHNKLGTQGERVARVQGLAKWIGNALGGAAIAESANTAAQLAKTDLVTDMVGEFPELQGIMGRYYALHDGLSNEIAEAIEDHYKPRFAGDSLPRSQTGLALALADKLETLAGLFGIGQIPTGDKDPFALRRHALGVIRMLVEKTLPLSLTDLIAQAFNSFGDKVKPAQEALQTFIYERLAGYCRELGYSTQEIDAVLSKAPQFLYQVPAQLAAVQSFASLPEAQALAAANKRITNILKKSTELSASSNAVNPGLLQEPAEQHLNTALQQVAPIADSLFKNGEFTASLRELAVLKAPVDAFFETVMVNAEDPALKANRHALLEQLHQAMNRVADLSRLAN